MALVALLAVGAVLSSILNSQPRRASVDIPTALPTATSAMGTPFQDGQIEFLVESIEPLDVSPEPPSLWFQVVTVRMTNTGASPQLVYFNDQRLLGDQGGEFSPDPLLSKRLNNGKVAVLLAPGGKATMTIPFALPINTEPVAVQLHAGPEIPGVAVPSP